MHADPVEAFSAAAKAFEGSSAVVVTQDFDARVLGPQVRCKPIDALRLNERNARTHSDEQIAQLKHSLIEFGWTYPALEDAQGIVAGHGRIKAARELYDEFGAEFTLHFPDGTQIPHGMVPTLPCDGWSQAKRRAYAIADNQLALNAGWDDALLAGEFESLEAEGFDLAVIGFSADELDERFGIGREGEGGGGEGSDGALLARASITIAEPTTVIEAGDLWRLGRHVLVVRSVVDDWPIWTKYLATDDALFCPYPGPSVPCSDRALEHSLVMVQPDLYIAGHIVDRYVAIFGSADVSKQSEPT